MGIRPSFMFVIGITDATKDDPRFDNAIREGLGLESDIYESMEWWGDVKVPPLMDDNFDLVTGKHSKELLPGGERILGNVFYRSAGIPGSLPLPPAIAREGENRSGNQRRAMD